MHHKFLLKSFILLFHYIEDSFVCDGYIILVFKWFHTLEYILHSFVSSWQERYNEGLLIISSYVRQFLSSQWRKKKDMLSYKWCLCHDSVQSTSFWKELDHLQPVYYHIEEKNYKGSPFFNALSPIYLAI